MKIKLSTSLLLVLMVAACGPGFASESGDDTSSPAPEWAYGFWQKAGPEGHGEYIQSVIYLEIRADGTMVHTIDYCDGPDRVYQGVWELQVDGAVRLLPAPGDDEIPFMSEFETYQYVDVRGADGQCIADVARVSLGVTPTTMERGRWCMGPYMPEFNDCPTEPNCDEETPVCE